MWGQLHTGDADNSRTLPWWNPGCAGSFFWHLDENSCHLGRMNLCQGVAPSAWRWAAPPWQRWFWVRRQAGQGLEASPHHSSPPWFLPPGFFPQRLNKCKPNTQPNLVSFGECVTQHQRDKQDSSLLFDWTLDCKQRQSPQARSPTSLTCSGLDYTEGILSWSCMLRCTAF